MDRTLWFASGIAVGMILGSRAGRAPYDRVVSGARQAWENPHVQDTARVVQARAANLYDAGLRRLTPNGKTDNDPAVDATRTRDEIAAP